MLVDNLKAHKGEKARELTEERCCDLLYPAALLAPARSLRRGLLEDDGHPA